MVFSYLHFVVVCLGGALGAGSRYVLGNYITQRFITTNLPWGTLSVNLLGCALMGALLGWVHSHPHGMIKQAWPFLAIGLLGGFTTFSAFGADTWLLVQNNHTTQAIIYVAISVFGGLLLCFVAAWATTKL